VLALLGCEAAQTATRDESLALLIRALRPPGLLAFVAFDAVAVQATMLSLLAVENTAAFDELADAVLGEAGRHGNLLTFLGISTFRAMALLHQGDLGGADVEAREATRSATEQGWQHGAGGLVALRAISLLEKGNLADAQRCLSDAATMHVPPGFPQALLLSARGRVLAEAGDVANGVEQLLACGRTLDGMRIHSPGVIPWRSDAAILLAVAGEYDRARELAAAEVELARTLSGPLALARALYGLAQATGGSGRLELLDEALRVAEAAGPTPTLTRAMICVEFGAALRRNKQPGDARVRLADGLEIAARCRCLPLANRAREELGILGVTPRRALAYGPDALTPSEVRVGRMAAQGMSNTEIAQRLFVTRKTVEKHLASAYRKLGIDSRTQLRLPDLIDRGSTAEQAPPAE
jgi:DNA-binding CsgD family transcriptional regulator